MAVCPQPYMQVLRAGARSVCSSSMQSALHSGWIAAPALQQLPSLRHWRPKAACRGDCISAAGSSQHFLFTARACEASPAAAGAAADGFASAHPGSDFWAAEAVTFKSLGLPDKIVQALQSAGFQQPAAVQVMPRLACSSIRGPCPCSVTVLHGAWLLHAMPGAALWSVLSQ